MNIMSDSKLCVIRSELQVFFDNAIKNTELMKATSRQFFSKCNEENNPPDQIETGTLMVQVGFLVDFSWILLHRFEVAYEGGSILEEGAAVRSVIDAQAVKMFNEHGWTQEPLDANGHTVVLSLEQKYESDFRKKVREYVESVAPVGTSITDEMQATLVGGLEEIIAAFRSK